MSTDKNQRGEELKEFLNGRWRTHRLLEARFDLFVRKHELVVKWLNEEALAKPRGSYDFAVNDSAFFPSSTTVTGTRLQKKRQNH